MEFSPELSSMQQVIMVYEELGGDQGGPVLGDLVTPYRKFVRVDDIQVREAPFSQNKKVDSRLYIFKDLVILAKSNSSALNVESMFNLLADVTGGIVKRPSASTLKHSDFGTATLTGAKGKFKVSHYLDLHKCHIKPITPKTGECTELELMHVSREYVEQAGVEKVITKIEKVELSFPSHELCDEIYHTIHDEIDELDAIEMQRRESSIGVPSSPTPSSQAETNGSASAASTPAKEHKKREWAKKRGTLKTLANEKTDDGHHHSESISGISDIGIVSANDSHKAEFEVQFGDGPMGFALGSSTGVGVVVGRLAPGGFAELGGVCIGDRIVSLNDKDIGFDMPWQKVVDEIKQLPRPLTIKFERLASRQKEHEHQHGKEGADGHLHRSRSWAARRAHANPHATAGTVHLQELEKMYKKRTEKVNNLEDDAINFVFDDVKKHVSESEAKVCHVFKEIYTTEKLYVADLQTLVGEYIIPLRRTERAFKCKEVEGGSTICEHGLIRATCGKTSSEKHALMSPDDIKHVFLNVETLVSVNSELLHVLEKGLAELGKKCQKDGIHPTLGAIAAIYSPAFVKVMPFFKMYSIYCHKYAHSSIVLQEIRQHSHEVDDFLSSKEKKSQKTSLKSLLIKPIQRICKYPLLFSELLRSFPQTDDLKVYYTELTAAAHAVDEIAESVNKNVGDREAVERIMEAYEELGGEQGVPGLITAHRKFLHHNNVILTVVGEKETKKEHTLYLFNDLIIFAKGVHSGFSVLGRKSSLGLGNKFSFGSRKSFGPSSSHHSNSNLGTGHGGTGKSEKSVLKVVHRLDLHECELKLVPEPDAEGFYCFVIKYVERVAERDSKSGSSKVLTNVMKFEVWCSIKEDQEDLYNEITALIKHQEELVAGQKKAEAEQGNSVVKAKRSWRDKGGTASMQQLATKYSHGKT